MARFRKDNLWFQKLLLKWNKEKNKRKMPWKGEKDPYKIWLSEIILQQTRVSQGLEYYNKFIAAFPDVHQLARSKDEKIFKMWEGLGYYNRCKNLLVTARYISKDLDGKFPQTFEEIRSLKGVGMYTASAIASFAFDQPYAVVDGNVIRILSRVFGIKEPLNSTTGKKKFTRLSQELLSKKQPGIYNQAIMDFGAVICKPAAPLCSVCPFNKKCFALQHDQVSRFPVNEKKISIRHRRFNYFIIEYRNRIAIRQRKGKDIWQYLFEFPLVETAKQMDIKKIMLLAEKNKMLKKGMYHLISFSPLYKQRLSHQLIEGRFIRIRLKKKPGEKKDWLWTDAGKLKDYAFPVFINQYLKKE